MFQLIVTLFMMMIKMKLFLIVINSLILVFFVYFASDEGYYQSGKFQFEIVVPEAYNMVVSSPVL